MLIQSRRRSGLGVYMSVIDEYICQHCVFSDGNSSGWKTMRMANRSYISENGICLRIIFVHIEYTLFTRPDISYFMPLRSSAADMGAQNLRIYSSRASEASLIWRVISSYSLGKRYFMQRSSSSVFMA